MKKERILREKKWQKKFEKRNKEITDSELQEMRHQCTQVIEMLKVEMPKVSSRYVNALIDADYHYAHPLGYKLAKLTKHHPLPHWLVTLLDIVLLLPLLLLYILSILLYCFAYLSGKIDREFMNPPFSQFRISRYLTKPRQSFEADTWDHIRNEPGEAYATARVVLSSSATLERVQQAINSSAENVRMLHKCFLAIGDEGKDFYRTFYTCVEAMNANMYAIKDRRKWTESEFRNPTRLIINDAVQDVLHSGTTDIDLSQGFGQRSSRTHTTTPHSQSTRKTCT